MKKTIQLFLLLFLMSMTGKAQIPGITNLSIIPANPTEADTIFVVGVTNYMYTPNYMQHYYSEVIESNITVYAHHYLGTWAFGLPTPIIMQIGSVTPGEYQLTYQVTRDMVNDTLSETLSFTVSESPIQENDSIITEQNIALSLSEGWNMIGYTCQEPLNVIEAFSTVEDKIIIVKDNLGNSYLPEFGYDGIGDLEFAKGYQLKITEDITDFYFCPTLIYSE